MSLVRSTVSSSSVWLVVVLAMAGLLWDHEARGQETPEDVPAASEKAKPEDVPSTSPESAPDDAPRAPEDDLPDAADISAGGIARLLSDQKLWSGPSTNFRVPLSSLSMTV